MSACAHCGGLLVQRESNRASCALCGREQREQLSDGERERMRREAEQQARRDREMRRRPAPRTGGYREIGRR